MGSGHGGACAICFQPVGGEGVWATALKPYAVNVSPPTWGRAPSCNSFAMFKSIKF